MGRKIATSTIIIGFLSFALPFTVLANTKKDKINKDFDINLTAYDVYGFGSFNQIGYEITPLAQLYFRIIQEEEEWIDEPRLYIKGNEGYVHLWKKDGTNVLYKIQKQTSGMLKGFWDVIEVKRKKIDRIPVPKNLLNEVLIERLAEPIREAVNTYYGESKLWNQEKVLKIEKDEQNYVFYVTVQVRTFEGAHSPPYGEETITFRIKRSEIDVIDYKHRDIPKEEWTKLKLR